MPPPPPFFLFFFLPFAHVSNPPPSSFSFPSFFTVDTLGTSSSARERPRDLVVLHRCSHDLASRHPRRFLSSFRVSEQVAGSSSPIFDRPRTPVAAGIGIKELTFKFSGSAAGLFGDSFPFLGYVVAFGRDIDPGVWSGKDGKAYGGIVIRMLLGTRLICASFESTRLICASLGITRLIGVSFGITRLICAFYGTTRLLCRVRAQREADRREAGRMREGHMDASGFLYASADVFWTHLYPQVLIAFSLLVESDLNNMVSYGM
ncbi:hypothetical protein E6C27_scaffold6G001320 [Cucumis melo var. makuwa]|uniref:Uncharacterized protein n=1 Tax=Cucumis melo var. makuwa TaxID=1194695 RepID=A0A5A7TJD8_CUCMM|nr:hypothetical protein E6C27_scaffold6G001320 [Cucumis melo var. makuwa]